VFYARDQVEEGQGEGDADDADDYHVFTHMTKLKRRGRCR
jgi:hypothetical protein